MAITLAIDIGGTKIALARVEEGRITRSATLATDRTAAAVDVLGRITDAAAPWMAGVERLGVACTGHVQGGRVWAINRGTLPTWGGVAVAEELGHRLQRPVALLNDAHAMALAEHRLGAGRGTDPFAFVTISTGIGAGVVAGGRLLTGARGLAAHLGHVSVDPEGPVCGCGQRGCLERLASGRTLDEAARARLGDGASAATLFERARAGDGWARDALAAAAATVARALQTLQGLVDPAVVAIGGSVGLADPFLALLERSLADAPERLRPTLRRSELGPSSGVLGAALWAEEGA